MNVSYKWLKDMVDIPCSIEEYEKKMVLAGFEIECVKKLVDNIENVVVGRIEAIEKHPDADKLQVCMLNVGGEENIQIVTGATNVFVGAIVPVAMVNSKLPDGTVIKKGKLRGVASFGMLCGGSELGFDKLNIKNAEVDGILILEGEDYTLGQDIVSAVGLEDQILEFSITANRCDCMSMNGLALESAGVLSTKANITYYEKPQGNGECDLAVEVLDGELCPRYMAAVVDNIKIEPSPEWMQQRLRASGIRPINNIVDITNYVMVEYGQPMHAFDYNCISGDKIIVRRANEGEIVTTLDDVERTMTADMLLIADESKAVGIAGVMGGQNSQITEDTKKIVFESALFDSKSVRRTSKALGLMTDAAAKFSKGISPMNPEFALNRALQLIQELNCGTVLNTYIDIQNCDLTEKTVVVDSNRINQRIALTLDKEEMVSILERLNIKTTIDGDNLVCTLPYYRLDIENMEDVSEEVIRIFGYDNIPSHKLPGGGRGKLNENQARIKNLRNLLAFKGFNEVVTYSFTSNTCFDKLNLAENDYRRNVVRIINPLGEEQSVMRTCMADSMLTVMSTNKRRNIDDLAIFEFGKVYLPVEGEKLPDERLRLALGMYGNNVDFYDIKGIVESVLTYHGIKEYDIAIEGGSYLHPGRKCVLKIGETFLAEIGEVYGKVCDNYELNAVAYYADIDMATVYANENLEKVYTPIPRFPAVYRDLAVCVDKDTKVGYMKKAIEKNKYATEVEIFDIYEGAQVGEGKKSVAFSIVFRASDRTLSDKEINTQFDKIVKGLGEEFGAELR